MGTEAAGAIIVYHLLTTAFVMMKTETSWNNAIVVNFDFFTGTCLNKKSCIPVAVLVLFPISN